MYCNKCGEKISKDDKFCPYCGTTYVESVRARPKSNVIWNFGGGGPIPIVIFMAVFLMPIIMVVVLSKNLASAIFALISLLVVTLLIFDHVKFENDESLKFVSLLGLKVKKIKLDDIGYCKILPLEFVGYRNFIYRMRPMEICSKGGIVYHKFFYSRKFIEWIEYYGIEVKREYSID